MTIVHGLPDTNAGGSALGIALVDVLKKIYSNHVYTYVSSHRRRDLVDKAYPFISAAHPDLDITPYPIASRADHADAKNALARRIKGILWALRTLLSIRFLLFPSLGKGNESFAKIRESDLVISRGTQIFYDKKGHVVQSIVSKYWLCVPLLYAWRVGVPFVIYAQTIGPIHHSTVRCLIRFVLKRAAFVLPREQASHDYLINDLALPQDRVRLVPDSVFGLERPSDEFIARTCRRYDLEAKSFACIVLRHFMERMGESGDLVSEIAEACEILMQRRIVKQIVIATQCHHLPDYDSFECDSDISNELYRRLAARLPREQVKLIDEPLSPETLMGIYGGARYVVSVRLHAAIFSMIVGTPAIAISYWGTKTTGIFAMLGLDSMCIRKDDLDASRVVDQLTEVEQDYDHFVEALAVKIDSVHQHATQTPLVFQHLLDA